MIGSPKGQNLKDIHYIQNYLCISVHISLIPMYQVPICSCVVTGRALQRQKLRLEAVGADAVVRTPLHEDSIYAGTKCSSGQPFLDSIIPGSLLGLDTKEDQSWFP